MWRKVKAVVLARLYLIYTPLNKLSMLLNGVKYGKGLRIKGLVRIHNPKGKIIIGDNVRINSTEWANPIGFSGKTNFQIVDNGEIIIGNDVGISIASFTCAKKIVIENNVLLGAGVKIYDTDFHPLQSKYRFSGEQDQNQVKSIKIIVGEGSFIGAGSIILKGTRIGKNCVIGAGSVVSGEIPDGTIYAGNPAKFIKNNE